MSDAVYEMLWDCRFCGTHKLLGLTHRFCPNCGAAQDAGARYFPPDSEKVAVKSHVYYGADVICRYCQNASSRLARHCGHCGAPLEEGSDVARRAEQAPTVAAPAASPKRRRLWLWLVPLVLTVAAIVVTVAFVWKKEAGLRVEALRWERSVEIEGFGPVSQSAWCNELPSDATGVSRRREARSTKRVPDGEDCQVRKADRGDGTFVEKRECTPKYREEPVYADKCSFSVNRWHKARVAHAEGSAPAQQPRTPEVVLARSGTCVGCERAGKRTETYTVVFRDAEQKEHRCEFEERRWSGFALGSRYTGAVRRVVGSLDCDSLKVAR